MEPTEDKEHSIANFSKEQQMKALFSSPSKADFWF
jgi:hypothetical protein